MNLFLFLLTVALIVLYFKVSRIRKALLKRIEFLEKELYHLKFESGKESPEKMDQSISPDDTVMQEAAPEADKTADLDKAQPEPVSSLEENAGQEPPPLPFQMTQQVPGSPVAPEFTVEAKPADQTKQGESLISKWKKFSETVDWELFTGTRLFAFLGGVALFIAAGFFVKYSIDKNLIPPEVRLAIGALTGTGLIVASGRFRQAAYDIMKQTLAAGGIGVLYSVVFAATLYYHYLPNPAGFALLSLISASAFALSSYYRRISISVLGAVGAYITPLLVSSGDGSLYLLFLYLAIVNIGLFKVSRFLESPLLIFTAAAGTLVTAGAATAALIPDPAPTLPASVLWSAAILLFTLFFSPRSWNPETSRSLRWSGIMIFCAPLLIACALTLLMPGASPLLITTTASPCAIFLGFRNSGWYRKVIPYSILTFAPVVLWAFLRFDDSTPAAAWVLILIYGVTGGLGPVALIQRYGTDRSILRWLKAFPAAIAAATLICLAGSASSSPLLWPVMLCLQLTGIVVSLLIGAFAQVVTLLLLFLGGGIYWLLFLPGHTAGLFFFVFLLTAGSLLFAALAVATHYLAKIKDKLNLKETSKTGPDRFRILEPWLPAMPPVGVCLLTGFAFTVAHPHYPHAGMVTLILFLSLTLFFVKRIGNALPGAVVLLAACGAQSVWVLKSHAAMDTLFSALAWSSGLFAAALAVPFLFFKNHEKWKPIWNCFALFELIQVLFFLHAGTLYWDSDLTGWIPLIPAILKMIPVFLLLKQLEGKPERNTIVAFHGGVLLFYVSTLPVLLLHHGWIGVAFVFESSLLLWLNKRIEHPGLRWTALALAPAGLLILVKSVALLKGTDGPSILNPAIFSTAACTAALWFASRFAHFPGRKLKKIDLPDCFLWLTLGTGFYLMNLVISDFFAAPGESFQIFPIKGFVHAACFGLGWTAFGALLWNRKNMPFPMRAAGLIMLVSGASGLVLLPTMLPQTIAQMAPIINPALIAYTILLGILYLSFHKESRQDQESPFYHALQQTILALFLVSGLILIMTESATVFDAGRHFTPLFSHSPSASVASAAAWLIYGTGILIWPRTLNKKFRIAGIVVIAAGLAKSLLFPLKFKMEFAEMIPLLNAPSLLYLGIILLLLFFTARQWKDLWPIHHYKPASVWGTTLAIVSFIILNIEIAVFFTEKGRAFSFLTHGTLSMQLAYSIGWMIFSIILLAWGIRFHISKARWAAIILLVLTSFKIFILDLWSLGQLYRVGSFMGLAAVMILVSFLYQKFLSGNEKETNTPE